MPLEYQGLVMKRFHLPFAASSLSGSGLGLLVREEQSNLRPPAVLVTPTPAPPSLNLPSQLNFPAPLTSPVNATPRSNISTRAFWPTSTSRLPYKKSSYLSVYLSKDYTPVTLASIAMRSSSRIQGPSGESSSSLHRQSVTPNGSLKSDSEDGSVKSQKEVTEREKLQELTKAKQNFLKLDRDQRVEYLKKRQENSMARSRQSEKEGRVDVSASPKGILYDNIHPHGLNAGTIGFEFIIDSETKLSSGTLWVEEKWAFMIHDNRA